MAISIIKKPTAYTAEEAQDAIGTILTDTASIDFTYDDVTPEITADVIPGGVDHNALLNTHDLTTDIDHDTITNTHNLTTDISHDLISDVSADDHHAQVHTIVSHDTTATGANLTTLTDTSNADVLHAHAAGIDWTIDQGATNIHAGNYTDTNTTAHASFSQLDYASAAHTGFAPALGADDNYVTDAEKALLANKTSYVSVSPHAFIARYPDVDDVRYGNNQIQADADTIRIFAPVNLPHGAVITEAIVYGNAGAESSGWILLQIGHTIGLPTVMASGSVNTADTTISVATIDNQNYSYGIEVSELDTGDDIYGAMITYTTDYD